MRKSVAYTLAEVLVVIAIVSILAGFVGSVIPGAQRSAKATRSLAEMRQISLAVSLYRETWEAIPTASTVDPMLVTWWDRLGLNLDLFRGCGKHPNRRGDYAVIYFFMGMDYPYEAWVEQYGDSLPACFDLNCSSPEVHPDNRYESKYALAVTLSGSAVRVRKAGDPFSAEFWISK